MLDYRWLDSVLLDMNVADFRARLDGEILPKLVRIWSDDYLGTANRNSEVVETSLDGLSYLFDVVAARLIAAWAISRGRRTGKRDSSRMAGHPLGAGSSYHRGHAIPHTLGGGTDINLVAQLGAVNIGPFRVLERKAVRMPGALYFTYWMYDGSDTQTPCHVDQGLLVPGFPPDVQRHSNERPEDLVVSKAVASMSESRAFS